MCKLNPEFGWAAIGGTLFLAAFTFIVVVPGVKVWELTRMTDCYIRLQYARMLEKRAYCLESQADLLKEKADKIKRTTG